MRRTHILHKRDNRRAFPSHREHELRGHAPRDSRVLSWLREGERQIMTLDGVHVATVEPDGEPRYEGWEYIEPHRAMIHGQPFESARTFNSRDEARGFCEAHFSASPRLPISVSS